MKKLLLLLASAFLIPAAYAVDAVVHKKCLKASDYKGCIEVLSGAIKDQVKPGTQNIKLNIDTQVTADGNQCPSEFAYAGGGYCRRVICDFAGLFGAGHHPDLAGKGMRCPKGIGQMRWGKWDEEKVRASNNPECPDIQLKKGFQNTCHQVGRTAAQLVVDGRYQEAIDKFVDYPKILEEPLLRTIYAGVLWKTGKREKAIPHYLQAAEETEESADYRWITWIGGAGALYYQDSDDYRIDIFAKKAIKAEPNLLNEKFQRKNYDSQEALDILRGILKRPGLQGDVRKIERKLLRNDARDDW